MKYVVICSKNGEEITRKIGKNKRTAKKEMYEMLRMYEEADTVLIENVKK